MGRWGFAGGLLAWDIVMLLESDTVPDHAMAEWFENQMIPERIGGEARRHIAMENPPSTAIAVPVTKFDASLARKAATPDMSRGTPQRPSGVRFSTLSCSPVTCWRARFVRSVSIHPGNTAFTWMLSLAQAVASARVICTMPPLELA